MRSRPTKVVDPEVLLWPRLSRFYGLSWRELSSMPRVLVRVYAEALDPLQSEEQLLAIQAASFPYYTASTQKRINRNLIREVEHGFEPAVDSKPPNPSALAGLGIGVRYEGK